MINGGFQVYIYPQQFKVVGGGFHGLHCGEFCAFEICFLIPSPILILLSLSMGSLGLGTNDHSFCVWSFVDWGEASQSFYVWAYTNGMRFDEAYDGVTRFEAQFVDGFLCHLCCKAFASVYIDELTAFGFNDVEHFA